MIVTCPKCNLNYDDARCFTTCPHYPLMSDSDMDRKDAGIDLLNRARGRHVRFIDGLQLHPDFPQSADGRYTIQWMRWDGWVGLADTGNEWVYPPGVFEVID